MNDRAPNTIVFVAIATVLVAFGAWFWAARDASELNAGTELAKAITGFRRTLQQASEPPRLAGEPEALARVENTRLVALASSAAESIEAAAEAARRWHTDVESLLENEEGRAIATAPDLLNAFDLAWRQGYPPRWDTQLARTQVTALLHPVARGADDPTNTVAGSETLASRLTEIGQSADKARAAFDHHRESIQVVVARARARDLLPGSILLSVALEEARTTARAVENIRMEADDAITRAKAGSRAYQQLYAPHIEVNN